MYDIVIVGAGPAGLTAAIYTSRKNLKTLVISKDIGGQAAISGDIENYLGFTVITGPELATKFKQHVQDFEGLELIEGAEVVDLEKKDNHFVVTASDDKTYQSKAVIVASGRFPKLLGVPGEKEFFGKGVGTCATCDAPLFRGKSVAVVGGGNAAMDAANLLAKFASKVYVVNINSELTGDDEILKEKLESSANISCTHNAATQRIHHYPHQD